MTQYDKNNPVPGARVFIPAGASGEHHPVVGVLIGLAGSDPNFKGYAHVQRDDGKQGRGVGGSWLVPDYLLEPEEILAGSAVEHQDLTYLVEGVYSHPVTGSQYVVARAGHGGQQRRLEVPREVLTFRWGPGDVVEIGTEKPADGDQLDRLREENPPAQPPRVAEMQNWNFDMRVPLNHGARFPTNLPNDSDERKKFPLGQVLFGQFGAAMVDLARHSWEGNNKHNPGQALQDARNKSNDDLDCALRHLMEGDYRGAHWRIARLHQKQLEADGAPIAPLATFE